MAAGRFAEAASVLDEYVDQAASREERVLAALLRAACADGDGRREEAVAHYREAAALMEEVPDFPFYAPTRSLAEKGMQRVLEPGERKLDPWVTRVPQ